MLRIEAPPEAVGAAMDALLAAGALEIELQGDAVLGLFPHLTDDGLAGRVAALLAVGRAAGGRPAAVTIEAAEMLDWDTVWKPTLRSFRAGPLTVAALGAEGDLVLDVGAFGTGQHATSRLCVERLVERVPAGPVLDVGTGSGVLALVALALGAPSAIGTDTDPVARRVAEENAARNGFSDRFVAAEALPDEVFELVLANLNASLLRDLVESLSRRVASGGELVVSGFTEAHAAEVAGAFTDRGLRVVGAAARGGWSRLDLAVPW